MTDSNDNISFSIVEDTTFNNNNNLIDLMDSLDSLEKEFTNNQDLMVPYFINYNENYTVKELLLICEYYGIVKEYKLNKCNKEQIMDILIQFEINPEYSDIVSKRKNMWFYANELKNDKFMKKYVIW